MQEYQQECQLAEDKASTDPSIGFSELNSQDENQLLREQVDTLKLELSYQSQQLQEIQQELSNTNHDLCTALMAERLTLDEAKELAKEIVITQKPIRESLAQLLSAIYISPVESGELGCIPKPTLADRSRFSSEVNKFNERFDELKTQLTTFQGQLDTFKARREQLSVQIKTITETKE